MSLPETLVKLSDEQIQKNIDKFQFQLSTLDFRTPDFASVKDALKSRVRFMEVELRRREAQRTHQSQNKVPDPTSSFFASFDTRPLPGMPIRDQQLQRPQSSPSTVGNGVGFGAYADPHQNGFGGHFASDGLTVTQPRAYPTPSWSFSPLENPPVTPTTNLRFGHGSNTASDSSPEQMSANSTPPLLAASAMGRKRQRESLNLLPNGNTHGVKSMRATPSPAVTGTATPASEDSFDFENDPDLLRLFDGDPRDDWRAMRETQKALEKQARERAEQLQRDHELAQSMMFDEAQQGDECTSGFASPSPGLRKPFASSLASSQTTLDTSGNLRRPGPSTRAGPSGFSSSGKFRDVSIGDDSGAYTRPDVKIERPSTQYPPATSSGASNFIDLGSDDSYDEPDERIRSLGNDFVEIDASSFRPSARSMEGLASSFRNRTVNQTQLAESDTWTDIDQTPMNSWTALPDSSGTSSFSYHDVPGYGDTDVYGSNSVSAEPNPFAWSTSFNNLRQGLAGGIGRGINAVNSLLDRQIDSYSALANGYRGMPAPGSSHNPRLLGHFPAHDQYGESRQRSLQNLVNNNPFDPNDPTSAYQRYMDRVSALAAEGPGSVTAIKSLLENIRPDEDVDPRTRIGTPESMSAAATLYEHQKLGLQWMIKMEEGSNKGGILADDMGLGKTIQAIALMVQRRSTDSSRKTTLIVAPVALLRQWESEIAAKVKPGREHRLTTYIYHGPKKKTTWEALSRFDVVLTTFGTIALEHRRKLEVEIAKRANPNWRPTSARDIFPVLGDECKWYRIILDEAQNIKNKDAKQSRAIYELQALTRFCMSGTPMMNNIGELFSLIHFLRIKPYCDLHKFNADFKRPLQSNSAAYKEQAMRKLQALLKAILLRRTKKSKIDGNPILTLPDRVNEVQHAVFSADEEAVYRSLETKNKLQFNRYLKAGTVGRNYSNVLVLLLRLRQACCHPHLIKDLGVVSGAAGEVSVEDLISIAKGLSLDVVARIKDQGPIECPICMDAAENATIFTPCGHSTCSECFTRIADPAQAMRDDDGSDVKNIKCPNCRGKVDPKKVTDYASFKKVHMPEEIEDGSSKSADPEADMETESDSEDSDSDSDLDGFVVKDDVSDDDLTEDEDTKANGEEDEYGKDKTLPEKSKRPKGEKKNRIFKGKGKARDKQSKPKQTLRELCAQSRKNAAARKKYLKALGKDWESSSKIEKTIEILQATSDRREGEKTIIFSQFTSLLDLVEVPIMRKGWSYRRYDGSMTTIARNDAVIDFRDKPDCRIMLVSLKAGNSGLNLTSASQVIILDPFWNPYIEEQAIDRAHRIGQRRPVVVHKVLVPNTVEDRIVALQERKRELIEGALDEAASANIGRLGTKELAFLFGVST